MAKAKCRTWALRLRSALLAVAHSVVLGALAAPLCMPAVAAAQAGYGVPLQDEEFRQIGAQGFGERGTSRAWSQAYFQNKLYILEATAPRGKHGQEQVQQSLGWLDENGIGLRYRDVYSNADVYLNGHPPPGRVDRAGTDSQAGQGRIDAPR
jgi:hypothetical protein